MDPKLPLRRMQVLLIFNFTATVLLSALLLHLLSNAEKGIMNGATGTKAAPVAIEQGDTTPPAGTSGLQSMSQAAGDTSSSAPSSKDSTGNRGGNAAAKHTTATNLSFYDILLMMLTAGGLGGVLCNLRGFFVYFRGGDNMYFPEHLEIPYYTRAFMGAGPDCSCISWRTSCSPPSPSITRPSTCRSRAWCPSSRWPCWQASAPWSSSSA